MKQGLISIILIILIFSCTHKKALNNVVVSEEKSPEIISNFFPVTTFLKGQLLDIKTHGSNPLKITSTGSKIDSVWLKMEDVQTELSPFLQPEIDTANLNGLFTEKKFLDQTLDAYTFTYDPIKQLPDSMALMHWDVYVKPENGKVTRIYILKKIDATTQQQLTWQSAEWAKIVTLKTNSSGTTAIENEKTIKWSF